MWVLLVVGQVMLQTCTGEGGAAPGPLTTAATGGPIGAKAWTHGCCLTAVVSSHRCTGLFGRKDGNEMGKGIGERKQEVGEEGKERG